MLQVDHPTEWITQYEINPVPGGLIDYTLNIIDTPALDDKILKEQLRAFLSKNNIDVDSVAILIDKPDLKLAKDTYDKSKHFIKADTDVTLVQTRATAGNQKLIDEIVASKRRVRREFIFKNSNIFSYSSTRNDWKDCQSNVQKYLDTLKGLYPPIGENRSNQCMDDVQRESPSALDPRVFLPYCIQQINEKAGAPNIYKIPVTEVVNVEQTKTRKVRLG